MKGMEGQTIAHCSVWEAVEESKKITRLNDAVERKTKKSSIKDVQVYIR